MRILMTTDCVGGVWTYSTTLCRALAPLGVDVTLAITGGAMSDAQRREVDHIENVTWHHRPYKCEWMQPPLADVTAAGEWLESLWDECVADVVHLNDFAHGDRWFGHAPRLIVWHSDVVSWHREARGVEPDALWDEYRAALQKGVAGADAIVDLGWLGGTFDFGRGEPIRTSIANAIEVIVDPAAEREPIILAAGRVWDEAKNLRVLCEAAADLPWPVKIAGDASHPDGGTADLPTTNVELLGPLPRSKLHDLMSRAAIFCAPAMYEPFGLAIAEAARLGCALVISRIPTLMELWGSNALSVDLIGFDDGEYSIPANDPTMLADALRHLIENDERRKQVADDCRATSTLFTPERQGREYLDLYRRLIERGRRPAA